MDTKEKVEHLKGHLDRLEVLSEKGMEGIEPEIDRLLEEIGRLNNE